MVLEIFQSRQFRRKFPIHRVRMKTWATVAMAGFIGLVVFFLCVGILFAWYAKDLPRPDKVRRTEGLSTVILDRNGETIYDIFENQNRLPVKWEDIPEYLRQATIAIEDKDFYKHQGLSTTGIIRGVAACFFLRRCQGGSTLTQQLVKNVLLSGERTLPRKMKEAILSIQIERRYTKDEILQMYLNEAPYGGTAVGVEAASQYYFGKPVKELNLVESAIIAGLPQSPSRYSPFTGEEKAYVWRSEQVLRRMREDGYITPIQETEARKALPDVDFANEATSLKAPHFVAYIKDQLVKIFGSKVVDAGGLKVTTTLDSTLQEKAQTIVKEEVDKAKKLNVTNGSAVVIDPATGEILVMVGSKDYLATDSSGLKFNVAVQGLRQPGSTIKPITYAAAFKKGYTAATVLMDVDTKYPSGDPKKPDYNPKNYDGKWRGPVQLRFALGNSINTIAVKVSALVGVRDILRLAYDMGLSSLEPTDANMRRIGLSLTLGGGEVTLLELTSAFGVFAAGGLRRDPVSILKVEDARGKVMFEHKPSAPRRVLSSDIAYLISDILSDNDARKDVFGANSYLRIPGKTVAVKTGTTDDKRDNWTIGYTPSVVVGTWVGNNDNSPMNPALASGVTGAAPMWNRIMTDVLKGKRNEPFVRPDNIIEMDIDSLGGGLPVEGRPTRKEVFIKGTEPTGMSPIYRMIKLSKRDGNKLASPVDIARGEFDTKLFIVIQEDDPVSSDGKNRWQEAIDAWVARNGDSMYHPPTEVDQTSDALIISVKEPSDYAQINGNDFRVRAEAAGSADIVKIELFANGEKKKDVSGKTFDERVNLPDGSYTLSLKATDSQGRTTTHDVRVGVNQPYATPTESPTLSPTP